MSALILLSPDVFVLKFLLKTSVKKSKEIPVIDKNYIQAQNASPAHVLGYILWAPFVGYHVCTDPLSPPPPPPPGFVSKSPSNYR